jgi:hypothetical protein
MSEAWLQHEECFIPPTLLAVAQEHLPVVQGFMLVEQRSLQK